MALRTASGPPPHRTLLQEQRYRRAFLAADGRQTSIVFIVTGLVSLLTIGNDLHLVSSQAALWPLLAIRLLHAVGILVALTLVARARSPQEQDRAFTIGNVVVVAMLLGTLPSRLAAGEVQGPLFSFSTYIGLLYFAQRGPLRQRAVVGVVIGGAAIGLLWSGGGQLTTVGRRTGTLALLTLNVVGILSSRAFEEQRRRQFEAERHERLARHELARRMKELAAAKDRAEAMSRARSMFLTRMSHEFRTPMNAVIGLSDLLASASLEAEHLDHVHTIRDSARALLAMLNEILDLAQIDAQKLTLSPHPFDLGRLADSVIDLLRPTATARQLTLNLELPPALPPTLIADDARLRQVLINLVANAIKFTEQGAVSLRITAQPLADSAYDIGFTVEDSGIGIAPESIERLFLPFEQADGSDTRRHGGSGLGLAISRPIIVAMGSDIHVDSQLGRGSRFSFTLRLPVGASGERSQPALLPVASADRTTLDILVVDDNPLNRRVAAAWLVRLGHTITLASDGHEAINAAISHDYDVILMDLQMPGMGGIEATRRIGDALRDQPLPHIIAMTASVFEEDRQACRQAGMHDFIGKPIDIGQIDALLSRIAVERAAARAGEPTVATLAPAQLERLRQLERAGERDFVKNLCQLFLDDSRLRLPRLSEALHRGQAAEIEREAHSLRSASATLGATELATLCARLESDAHEGRLADVGVEVPILASKFAALERALRREIQRPSATDSGRDPATEKQSKSELLP